MSDIYILGYKINDVSLEQVIQKIENFLVQDKKSYITTPNPEICLLGYNNKAYRRIHLNSFLSIPDGTGLKLGAWLFGQKLHNITTGADLSWEIIKLAEHKNYSILFFEGRPLIGDQVLKVIKHKFPHIKIKFIDPGQVDKLGNFENPNLLRQINEYSPDIILVNFGAPKQEYFIQKNIDKLNVKLMLGIGGSLDFISGRITRAPKFLRKLSLEWLWRLIKEPWRWSRIFKAVIIFPLACLRWRLGNLLFYRKNVAAMIINSQGQILIGQHAKRFYWQLPQGGVKKGESLLEAVNREIYDEIGTDKFQVLTYLKNCYKYKFPKTAINIVKFKGQRQSLALLKFTGQPSDIQQKTHEFRTFKWVNKTEILNLVDPFKVNIVKIGLERFKNYL
jgi:N-acetylglucosaminyldiphosphoundecaprenol N-acetyl-beta-D-mannosaminyltransferase